MPSFTFTSPEGKSYTVNGPEGSTQEQAWAILQQQIGYKEPPVEKKKPEERTWGEAAKDVGAGIVQGAGALVQLPGQLYGLTTGNFEDTGLLHAGKQLAEYGDSMKSKALKQKEANRAELIARAEQEGQWEAFKTAFSETVKDPALLTSFLAEQAPQLLVPFGAAKVGKAAVLAKGLGVAEAGAAGTTAAIGAGAIQQGADIGSQAYENIYKELISKGASEQEAKDGAINLARATGAGASIISVLAQRLPGARTLEESLAGVPGKGARVVRGLKGAGGESLSEVTEETGGQFLQNLAMQQVKPEQSLTAGLGQTAGLAAIGGGALGGVSGLLTSTQKAEIDNARDKAEETGKPQVVTLQLPYDPNVDTGTYGATTIIVNPDGSTEFPSEKNQFREPATDELTTAGLREKYTPQDVEKAFADNREAYASEEDKARVEQLRYDEARRSSKYMTALDEMLSKQREPKEEAKKAAESAFNTVMDDSVLASFGIGHSAQIRKSGELDGLDISNPEDATKVQNALEAYKNRDISDSIKTKIDDYLSRKEFITPEIPVGEEVPATENTIAFIPRGASEVKTYPGNVIKEGDKYFVQYDRGEGRKGKKEVDPSRVLINPTPDEIELLSLHKELTKLSNRKDVFKKFLYKTGISPELKSDLGASDLRVSPYLRNNGANIDDLTSRAIDEGLMHSTGDNLRDAEIMMGMVSDALNGHYVLAGENAETYAEIESIANRISEIQDRIQPMNEEDIASFIEEEKHHRATDRAIEEAYYSPTVANYASPVATEGFTLEKPTRQALEEKEAKRVEAEKTEAKEKAKVEAEEKAAREKKEIQQASEKAAGQFELGKTAEENLSGQKDIFAEAPKVKKTMKELARRTPELEKQLKEMSREDMADIEKEAMNLADKIEGHGEKEFATGLRSAVKNKRIKSEKDLDFYKKREQEYAARVGKAKEEVKEKYTLENFSQGHKNDLKRLSESKGLFATETTDLVAVADDYIQRLTDAINEKGYKVIDVDTKAPADVQLLRDKMSEIAGSMTRLLKEQEHLDKNDRFANEGKYLATIKVLSEDFNEVDDLLGSKEEKALGTAYETEGAKKVSEKYNGYVVYNNGDLSLVRAFAIVTGKPIYIPVKGTTNALVDVDTFNGKWIPEAEIKELREAKQQLEAADEAKHKAEPFIKFKNGFAKSANVPDGIAGILNGWKNMLGLKDINVYVTTFKDAKENIPNFTGPHRVIGSATLDPNDNGSMRKMPDGSYYVAFKDGTSKRQMLEVLAHELGHVHEREAYMNAPSETRNAIRQEFNKWLESQKGKTARELVDSLRARETAKITQVRAGAMADNLTPYWKSFSEWYADQVSRWATTSEKPVGVVEKFFDRLARAIRNFFNKIQNAKWLPNETFKQYLDDIASKNMIIDVKPSDPVITNAPEQMELFSRTKAEEVKLADISDKDYLERIKKRFTQKKVPFKERWEEMRPNLYDRVIKGLFDEFRFIKKYSPEAYMKARLSKSVDGALEGLLYYGQVKLTDGALDIVSGTKGLIDVYKPLGNEIDNYQIWKALNRDASLPADKRSFEDLLDGRDKLVEGEIDGKPRVDVYREVLKEENKLNKSVLDIAKQQGLIDEEAYDVFSKDIYYIPFYKAIEETGDVMAISAPGKLTGQYFSKALKGGDKKTNDLMENVLMNWSHILSASMKNKAALDTLNAAESMGAAKKVKSTYEGKDVVKVREDGKQAYYAIEDADLLDSISLISYMGPKSPWLNVAKGFTNALRYGVTLSPAYKIRNLIRDSVQSAAVSPIGANVLGNVLDGLKLSDRGNPTFMAALMGGGVFEMGVAHEGDQAKLIKRLIDKGVKPETILDDPKKIKEFLGKALDWYNEQGNRFENANRLALYKQLRDQGRSHLEASYQARDLMDFSLQGSFRAIKVVSQVVPFFNARLQGLYKLGRDGVTPTYRVVCNMVTGEPIDATDKQKAQRFMVVTSSVMLASMLLYMQFKDDEDFKRREGWDRDNFWWFKVNGVIFRVPKPFEIGAAGTIAERTLEQVMDADVEGKVFAQRMHAMLSDTFSLNPVPQAFKPLVDLYANKDSFTGAPIETAGMERLSKQERYTDNTSALAKALGGISQAGAKIITMSSDAEGISPVQVDYAIKAYFGWAGATAASISDKAVQPWSDVEKPGKPLVDTLAMGFVKTVPETQSKWVTQFYDSNKMINEAFADMKRYTEIGDSEKVAQLYKEKGDLIALQKIYDRTSKQLAQYRKYEQMIARSNMPKEEKELEIRRLKLLISEVAEAVETMRVGLKR